MIQSWMGRLTALYSRAPEVRGWGGQVERILEREIRKAERLVSIGGEISRTGGERSDLPRKPFVHY